MPEELWLPRKACESPCQAGVAKFLGDMQYPRQRQLSLRFVSRN